MAGKSKAPQEAGKKGFAQYFKGVKKEISKVVWPTKDEITAYTIVVLCFCTACTVLFWLVDMGVLAALRNVLGITMN